MADDKEYVKRLMRISCSCGSIDNYINIPQDHGVVTGEDQQPLMNANDHVAKKHIIHFGNCDSEMNPERKFRKAMVGAVLGGPLLGGLVSDLLEDIGIISFKCTPKTDTPWKNVNEKHIIDGAPALTLNSCLMCRYGGVIKLVPLEEYPPDTTQQSSGNDEGENNDETQNADEQGCSVKEETMAAMEAAFEKIAATGAELPAGGEGEQLLPIPMDPVAMAAVVAASALAADTALSSYPKKARSADSIRKAEWERAFACSDEQREINYAVNSGIALGGDLLDSSGCIIDQEKLGEYRINNFSAKTAGCGAVAAYNIMHLLEPEADRSFADVIYGMEPYGVLDSVYGIMPCGLTDYLVRQGYEIGYEIEDIEEKAMDADAGILLSVTSSGAHYTAVQKQAGTRQLKCFNQLKTQEEEVLGNVMMTVNKKRSGGKKAWDNMPMKQF